VHVGEFLRDCNGMGYVGLTCLTFLSGVRCSTKLVSGSNLGELLFRQVGLQCFSRTPWPRLLAPGSFDRIVAA
jgi:hypothetical protein